MIRIQLTHRQCQELKDFRHQASSKDSEKALIILLSGDGRSVPEIATTLKRNPHTVRDWLKRYQKRGISGLSRKFSPGRPSEKRRLVKKRIKEILSHPPEIYGYMDTVWTVPLIVHDIKERLEISVSKDTVTRALRNLGYTYKRPSKKPPASDKMSREEKAASIQNMIDEIKALIKRKDSVIYALDESHFSTEPYLVRGWFFKRWPPQDINAKKERKSHILWMLESENAKVLLEEIKRI